MIVVVGVLTALGGEQLVEWSHRGSEVREAREALHAELAANGVTAKFSIEEAKCLAERMDAYDTWARGGPHPEEIRASFPPFASSNWDAVKSGAVSQMLLKERLEYSRYYDGVDNMRWVTENERGVFLRIMGLAKHEKLTPEESGRLIEDVGQARLIGRVRTGNVRAQIEKAKALGVEPKPFSQADKVKLTLFCGRPFNG